MSPQEEPVAHSPGHAGCGTPPTTEVLAAPDEAGSTSSPPALSRASTTDSAVAANSTTNATEPATTDVGQIPFNSRIADTVQVGTPSRTRNHPVKCPRSSRPTLTTPSPNNTKNSVHMIAQVAQMSAKTGSVPTLLIA